MLEKKPFNLVFFEHILEKKLEKIIEKSHREGLVGGLL